MEQDWISDDIISFLRSTSCPDQSSIGCKIKFGESQHANLMIGSEDCCLVRWRLCDTIGVSGFYKTMLPCGASAGVLKIIIQHALQIQVDKTYIYQTGRKGKCLRVAHCHADMRLDSACGESKFIEFVASTCRGISCGQRFRLIKHPLVCVQK